MKINLDQKVVTITLYNYWLAIYYNKQTKVISDIKVSTNGLSKQEDGTPDGIEYVVRKAYAVVYLKNEGIIENIHLAGEKAKRIYKL